MALHSRGYCKTAVCSARDCSICERPASSLFATCTRTSWISLLPNNRSTGRRNLHTQVPTDALVALHQQQKAAESNKSKYEEERSNVSKREGYVGKQQTTKRQQGFILSKQLLFFPVGFFFGLLGMMYGLRAGRGGVEPGRKTIFDSTAAASSKTWTERIVSCMQAVVVVVSKGRQ